MPLMPREFRFPDAVHFPFSFFSISFHINWNWINRGEGGGGEGRRRPVLPIRLLYSTWLEIRAASMKLFALNQPRYTGFCISLTLSFNVCFCLFQVNIWPRICNCSFRYCESIIRFIVVNACLKKVFFRGSRMVLGRVKNFIAFVLYLDYEFFSFVFEMLKASSVLFEIHRFTLNLIRMIILTKLTWLNWKWIILLEL